MKRLFAIAMLCAAVTGLHAAHVQFNFSDFTTATPPLTNRVLTIQPTNSTPRANGNNIITSDRISYTNDYNGSVTVSNMVSASYHCVMKGPFKDTAFQITVPDTNAVVNANTLLSVNTNSAPGSSAYSMTAADAAFVKKVNSWSTGQSLTNATVNGQTNFGSLIATNPLFVFGNSAGARVHVTNAADSVDFFAEDPGGAALRVTAAGGVRLPLQTPQTLVYLDSGPDLNSLPNGTGAVTNGPGGFGWISNFATTPEVNSASNSLVTQITTTSNGVQQKFSVASNATVIASSGSVTQMAFYGFTSLTQANGKMSIGAPASGSSATVSSNAASYIAATNINFVNFAQFTNVNGNVSIGSFGDQVLATLQTTDNTTNNIFTFTPPNNSAVRVFCDVVGYNSTSSASYGRAATFKNVAGTVTAVGASVIGPAEEDNAFEFTSDVTANVIRFRVAGNTGKTVNWTAYFRIYYSQ